MTLCTQTNPTLKLFDHLQTPPRQRNSRHALPDNVIFFGAGVDSMTLILGEVDQVHSVFLAVKGELLCPFLTVVDNNLVVSAAGDDVHPIIAVVDVGDLVLVVLVQLGHPHRPDHIVHQLHEGEGGVAAKPAGAA